MRSIARAPLLVATTAVAVSLGMQPPAAAQGAGSRPPQGSQRSPAAAQPAAPAQRAAPAQPGPSQAPAGPATGGQAPAAQTPPQPQRTEILNHDNWTVTCREFAEGRARRLCSASLQVINSNTKQVLFAWLIGTNNDNKLVSVVQTLPGVSITPGVELKLARGSPRKLPYVNCDPAHCEALILMDDSFIRDASATETAEALVIGKNGQGVQFKFPVKGFDKALAAVRP
jgi:invasion protein IalB